MIQVDLARRLSQTPESGRGHRNKATRVKGTLQDNRSPCPQAKMHRRLAPGVWTRLARVTDKRKSPPTPIRSLIEGGTRDTVAHVP